MFNEFQVRTKLIYGFNSLDQLGAEINKLGAQKVFLVTDSVISSLGLLDLVGDRLKEAGLQYMVFDGVEPDPVLENIIEAKQKFDESGCDTILAVGGGSCIDAAKAVAILVTNEGELVQFEGADKIPNPPRPVIAVPTTAGTGSEVTGSCVVIDRERKAKMSIRSTYLQPVLAFLDPRLLATVPPSVAAATGMDTLTHAIEAYVSTGSALVTDSLALSAIELTTSYLPAFVANNKNMEAAYNMQVACAMAAMAFQWARVATVHAMAHSLGGYHRIPHGVANAVLLPRVMEFSLIGNLDKFKNIAVAMGYDVEGLTPYDAAYQSVIAVTNLSKSIGIPAGMNELGVTEDTLEPMSIDADRSGICAKNPRITSVKDMVNIFRASLY